MTRFVFLNGKVVAEGDARISPFDRGLLLGDGIFETLRAYGGSPFGLQQHLGRLAESCRVARFDFPAGLEEAVRAVLDANALKDASIRITITRGPGKPGASPRGAGTPTLLVTALPIEPRPELWGRGLSLATAKRPHVAVAGAKTTNYLSNVLARADAEDEGADDCLFVDEKGFVVETSQANVFAVMDDELVTPPLSSGCLPGVTRGRVLALASAVGLRARERALARADLLGADEVFLTASVTEVGPVVALDGQKIGSGQPGVVARRIFEAYRNLTIPETETHKHTT